MLRINHFVPFYYARQLVAYQSWICLSGHIFVNPNVIVVDSKTGEKFPKTFKELSNSPSNGGDDARCVNGDNYCRHIQYAGSLDILLPTILSPMGQENGGTKPVKRGEVVPKPYVNTVMSYIYHFGSGTYTYNVPSGWSVQPHTVTASYSDNAIKLSDLTRLASTTYNDYLCETEAESVYDAVLNVVRVKLTETGWNINAKGEKTLRSKGTLNKVYSPSTTDAGPTGVYYYRTFSNPYTPELLAADLDRVYALLSAMAFRLDTVPIQCTYSDWDLLSTAMKSINALDSNSLENSVQLPGLRSLGSDMKKIALDINPSKGLLTAIKGVSRAYLINRYVVQTTLSDATELDEAIMAKNPSSEKSAKSKYVGPPLVAKKLPAVNVLLKSVDASISVLNRQYIKRYQTYHDNYGVEAKPFTGGMLTVVKVVFKPQAYTSAQKAWSNLRSWGLDPSLSHLWDLVPFSFAIDWFTKIGDRLESFGDFTTLTTQYDLIMRSTSNKKTLSFFVDEHGSQYSSPSLIGTVTVSDYERRVYNSFPAFQPTIGKAEPDRHVVEGAALIVQAL